MSTQPEPDCGSSSCIFSAKGGMRTNGPCRCYENAGFHGSAVMAAKQMLREVLLLRARLDAMPHDRTWTKDKPTARGWYWVSVAPDWRSGAYSFSPVTRCHVWPDEDNANIETTAGYVYFKLSAPCLIGAQWKRVDPDPADPFAETQPSYSQDSDLP